MAQRLTDMTITRVSLVDKGANRRGLAVLKRDEEAAMSDEVAAAIATVDEGNRAGIAGWLRKAADVLLLRPSAVRKTATFAEIVAGAELRDALSDSWYTLEDALWSAIYAYDENGQSLPLEAKKALVAQDLDEFKAYLLAQMDGGVAKREAGPAERASAAVRAAVAKVGRKISAARLERLTSAAEALNSVLAEVLSEEEIEKRASAQEDDMTPEELTAAIEKAIDAKVPAIVEEVKKGLQPAATLVDPPEDALTLEGVATAVLEIRTDLDAITKARGERTSADGQEAGGEPVKKSRWAGIF